MDTFAMTTIAFIGLGAMGAGMAANLVKGGHNVRAYDLNPAVLSAAVAQGCIATSSIKDCVEGVQTVVTMLPAGAHVHAVYLEADGILANAEAGALLLDCSTISVADARFVSQRAHEAGFDMCDAPVSGGVAAAANGGLTFMVGGTQGSFERACPILAKMGKAVIRAGDSGAGQAAKICNNMILAITMIGTCEAFVLAERLGLDPQAFFDIASQSSGQSWSMTSYAPVAGLVPTAPSNRDFTNGFAGSLMLKDVRLAVEAANAVGLAPAMGLSAEGIYSKYVSNYSSDRDFSGVIDMLRKQ
jgi:3-hydroxyisobutyrate dehydrogenase